MVAARERFLAGGWLEPLTTALVEVARSTGSPQPGLAVDLGAGTGHHLAAVVAGLPGWDGLAVDLSKHAARRAARAHPRIGAIVADTWRRLPVRDHVAGLVLATFAPRDMSEVARVLAADGTFLLATPAQQHLQELGGELGLLTVDPRKEERLARSTEGLLSAVERRAVRAELDLPPDAVADLVGMGPSAHHRAAVAVPARVSTVTIAVDITAYRHI